MTRETKIGLLVGLGFIIVFAMVLSQTGTMPPPGDDLPLTLAERERRTDLWDEPLVEVHERSALDGAANDASSGGPPIADEVGPLNRLTVSNELPSPPGLDRPPVTGYADSGLDEGSPSANVFTAQTERPTAMHTTRVAPALPQPVDPPVPSVRRDRPAASESPEPTPTGPTSPRPTPRSYESPPVKEYVVQTGDRLGDISKRFYLTAKKQVVEYLAKANKLEDANTVRAGQKIVIPPLPAELFEEVASFIPPSPMGETVVPAVDQLEDRSERAASRRAPRVADAAVPGRRDTGGSGSDAGSTRDYTVKPGDTFSTISQQELGSSRHWQSIQQLNPKVTPKALRPGMKIKLPIRPPVSSVASGRQVSA